MSPSDPVALAAAVAKAGDGVLDDIARQHHASVAAVLDLLPVGEAVKAPASAFEGVWSEIVSWGPIVFIVHSPDGVFEAKRPLPSGSVGRGFFNYHGESPVSGHLRIERLQAIYFVDRLFFGRRSCSVQFIGTDGDVMFKIFVGRDASRELDPQQVDRFESLRTSSAICEAAK